MATVQFGNLHLLWIFHCHVYHRVEVDDLGNQTLTHGCDSKCGMHPNSNVNQFWDKLKWSVTQSALFGAHKSILIHMYAYSLFFSLSFNHWQIFLRAADSHPSSMLTWVNPTFKTYHLGIIVTTCYHPCMVILGIAYCWVYRSVENCQWRNT